MFFPFKHLWDKLILNKAGATTTISLGTHITRVLIGITKHIPCRYWIHKHLSDLTVPLYGSALWGYPRAATLCGARRWIQQWAQATGMNEPIWLVVLTILKNISQWERRIIPYIMENKKYLKPPTSYYCWFSSPMLLVNYLLWQTLSSSKKNMVNSTSLTSCSLQSSKLVGSGGFQPPWNILVSSDHLSK